MLGVTWNWVMSEFKPDSWRQRELTVLFTKKNVRYIMWRLQGYNIVFLQTNTCYKTCFISGFRFFFIPHLALKLTYRRIIVIEHISRYDNLCHSVYVNWVACDEFLEEGLRRRWDKLYFSRSWFQSFVNVWRFFPFLRLCSLVYIAPV